MEPIRKMIVAYDGSPNSHKALEMAVNLAKQMQADLTIASVLAPSSVYAGFDPNNVVILGQLWEIAERDAKRALSEAEEYCQKQDLEPKTILLNGNPSDEIIKIAHKEQAGLIICGSRGLGGFEGLLMGSVAHKLVTYAKRPVLVVK